jgi:hypothetical protein
MRFKAFKNFSVGKLMDKNKKEHPDDEELAETIMPEIKNTAKTKTDEGVKNGGDSAESVDSAGIILGAPDIPIRPHGPAAELSLDPEDLENDAGITLDELDNDSVTLGEEVKINEVSTEKAAALKGPPAAEATTTEEAKPEEIEIKTDDNDSLNNLFSDDEEEENPLASLIDSLPDVSVR